MRYTEEDRRTHVGRLQTYLRRIMRHEGHPQPLAVDGIYGPETTQAVRQFQQKNGLPETGTVDRDTWNAIYDEYSRIEQEEGIPAQISPFPAPRHVIRPGASGGLIYILQVMLNVLAAHFQNFPTVSYTGVYDEASQRSVRKFRELSRLPDEDTVDKETWDRLAKMYNAYHTRAPLDWREAR